MEAFRIETGAERTAPPPPLFNVTVCDPAAGAAVAAVAVAAVPAAAPAAAMVAGVGAGTLIAVVLVVEEAVAWVGKLAPDGLSPSAAALAKALSRAGVVGVAVGLGVAANPTIPIPGIEMPPPPPPLPPPLLPEEGKGAVDAESPGACLFLLGSVGSARAGGLGSRGSFGAKEEEEEEEVRGGGGGGGGGGALLGS